jgi:hypothetical protein
MLFSGSYLAFWAAVFFIGSEETIQQMIAADGLLKIFTLRFIGFALLGSLFAVGIGLLSLAGTTLGFGKRWAKPKRVFRLALVLQIGCAFLGCLLFVLTLTSKWF